eukprot:scaffold15999_cov30-Tisochrysis_lutea.AAC.2
MEGVGERGGVGKGRLEGRKTEGAERRGAAGREPSLIFFFPFFFPFSSRWSASADGSPFRYRTASTRAMWTVALASAALTTRMAGSVGSRTSSPLMVQSLSASEVSRLSSAALAYLGDSVFETHARQYLLWPPLRHRDLVNLVRTFSCAEGQSAALKRLHDSGIIFSEEEEAWLRRGRNSAGRGPRRAAPGEYRDASSLECLLGYLHLTDRTRCEEILDFILGDPALHKLKADLSSLE